MKERNLTQDYIKKSVDPDKNLGTATTVLTINDSLSNISRTDKRIIKLKPYKSNKYSCLPIKVNYLYFCLRFINILKNSTKL